MQFQSRIVSIYKLISYDLGPSSIGKPPDCVEILSRSAPVAQYSTEERHCPSASVRPASAVTCFELRKHRPPQSGSGSRCPWRWGKFWCHCHSYHIHTSNSFQEKTYHIPVKQVGFLKTKQQKRSKHQSNIAAHALWRYALLVPSLCFSSLASDQPGSIWVNPTDLFMENLITTHVTHERCSTSEAKR